MHWYFEVLKKYAVFGGRARRKEYWFFTLFNVIAAFVLAIVDAAVGSADAESGFGLLSGLYTLAVLIPGIAVSVRRLHDTDHSGWWLLIAFVPLVGAIMLLVWMVRDGNLGHNRFGPNPKELVSPGVHAVAATQGQISTQGESQTLMAFCIRCGTKFPETAAYCPKCGTSRTA